jgi:hypothetical protein
MTAQLIEDMDFAEYLAHPALSASGMKRLLDSPARYRHEMTTPTDTPAMGLGRLIHAIAFGQPHSFTVKDWDGRTKDGKVRAAEVAEQGLDICSEEDWEVANGIANALGANPLAKSILYPAGARHEVSVIWADDETGVQLRCRFDTLAPEHIGDLKSTTYAKPEAMARSSATYGYYLSAAQYLAAAKALDLPVRDFYIVAAEKRAPYFLSVLGITETDLELAERLRRKAIRKYADCLERDHWPDYTTEISYPEAPSWWRYSVEDMTEEQMVI